MTIKRPPYERLLAKVAKKGNSKGDRTGTGTVSLFGERIRYDLSKGFPLITTKRVPLRLIASELVWFLQGDSNIKYLLERDNHIWSEWPFKQYLEKTKQVIPETGSDAWNSQLEKFEKLVKENETFANKYGDLGPVYGVQWVSWPAPNGQTINQIENVIQTIKSNPDSRRLIVSAWNPADLGRMALEPCHALFQFYVNDGKVSCQMYQRSADMFLGVPFNLASYALLTHMVAQQCDLEVGDLTLVFGDAHQYINHKEQTKLQLSRDPRPLPKLKILRKPYSIFGYVPDDFEVEGYDPHPGIKGPIAV